MNTHTPATYLQMRSLVSKAGGLQLSIEELPMPVLQADEVMIRIEAAPLNPSDIGLLFGTADLMTARLSGSTTHPVILADIRSGGMPSMLKRLDQSLPVGNEGAGAVVATGDSAAARALAGRSVATVAGAMYAQYRAGLSRSMSRIARRDHNCRGSRRFREPYDGAWNARHPAARRT